MRRTTSPTPGPRSPSGRRGAPRPRGVTAIRASPGSLPVTTSSSDTPGHLAARAPVAATVGAATGQSSTRSSSCERCLRKPTAPSSSAASRTRVRQCSPPASPSTGCTATVRSMPATRASCSATRKALSRRCAPCSTCWKSQPPHRPGPAWGHGGGMRSTEAVKISTASARRKEEVVAVTRAITRSPGREWRTKTTRPSGARATQPPPAATAPTSSSRSSVPPGVVRGEVAMAAQRTVGDRGCGRRRRTMAEIFSDGGVDPGRSRSS